MSEEAQSTATGDVPPLASGDSEPGVVNNTTLQENVNESAITDFANLPSPFQPVNPKMAEYKEVVPGSGNFFARSGGPPKNDWSGIDDSKPRAKKSTIQMRSTNPANEQKDHTARVEGLAVKLEMDGNLPGFYESMTRKLQGTGLDTIAHARDPFHPNEKPMVMVIKNHARYTSNLEYNIEKINEFAQANYDEFDQLNDNDAQELLFNSISDQLRSDLQLVVENSDCFVSMYLRLMDLVVSVSSAHHDKLRESIRTTLPNKYPGEDVKALCDFYKEAADELYRASQFDPTLILDMLQNISTVSVTGSFPFDILSKHKEVKDCLDRTAGLPREEVDKLLLKKKCWYSQVKLLHLVKMTNHRMVIKMLEKTIPKARKTASS